MNEHLPVVFLDYLDHLAKCQRCRIQAMTRAMLNELILIAYEGDTADIRALPVHESQAS